MNSITGQLAVAHALGLQMFSDRQSSLMGTSPVIKATPSTKYAGSVDCGHAAPNSSATKVSVHGVTGEGIAQRRSPIGGSAYGIPRNRRMLGGFPGEIDPRMGPERVEMRRVAAAFASTSCDGAPETVGAGLPRASAR